MPRALKVYRTPIGFHDAYVAVPTKKAALEAWGADRNLFASGRAELVTDPALTKAPLAAPGTVVKKLRGTAAEQFAELEKTKPRRARSEPAEAKRRVAKAAPRPSRAALDRAEQAIDAAKAHHGKALEAIARREAKLRAERRKLEEERDAELAELEDARATAEDAYEAAMRDWRG